MVALFITVHRYIVYCLFLTMCMFTAMPEIYNCGDFRNDTEIRIVNCILQSTKEETKTMQGWCVGSPLHR